MANKMPSFSPPIARWSMAIRFFHWTSVLLLIAIFVMINLHERGDPDYVYISLHKALGVTFFGWIVLRFLTRITTKKYEPNLESSPRILQNIASVVHALLYGLMLLLPFVGFMMSQFANRATNMFGLFEIPVLVEPNKEFANTLNQLHTDLLPPLLIALIVAHILGAVYHQIILRDKTMNRML